MAAIVVARRQASRRGGLAAGAAGLGRRSDVAPGRPRPAGAPVGRGTAARASHSVGVVGGPHQTSGPRRAAPAHLGRLGQRARRRRLAGGRTRAPGPRPRTGGRPSAGAPPASGTARSPGSACTAAREHLVVGQPGLDHDAAGSARGRLAPADQPGGPGQQGQRLPRRPRSAGASRCWSKSRKATTAGPVDPVEGRLGADDQAGRRRHRRRHLGTGHLDHLATPGRASSSSAARVTPIRSTLSRVEPHARAHDRALLPAPATRQLGLGGARLVLARPVPRTASHRASSPHAAQASSREPARSG